MRRGSGRLLSGRNCFSTLSYFPVCAKQYVVLLALSRLQLAARTAEAGTTEPLNPAGKLGLAAILVSAAVLIVASSLGWQLGLPTAVVGVVALLLVTLRDRSALGAALRGVSWSVLPLVAGLFMLVEALNRAGVLTLAARGLAWITHQPGLAARFLVAFAVALLSNGMNNLPVGLASGTALAHAHPDGAAQNAVQNAVQHAALIGVDLGPNFSVTGSLATILWLIALRRKGEEISGWAFLKVGLIVMPIALLLSIFALIQTPNYATVVGTEEKRYTSPSA